MNLSQATNISGGGTAYTLEFDVTKAGYKPIGIVGWSFSDRSFGNRVHVTEIAINSNTGSIRGNSTASGSITITTNCFIDVLYVRNNS